MEFYKLLVLCGISFNCSDTFMRLRCSPSCQYIFYLDRQERCVNSILNLDFVFSVPTTPRTNKQFPTYKRAMKLGEGREWMLFSRHSLKNKFLKS